MKDIVTKFGTNNVGETATGKFGMEKGTRKGITLQTLEKRNRPRVMSIFSKEQIRTGSKKKEN